MKKDEKYYAYFEHETVQAMLHSLFRFQTAMQAQLISNRFADQVILSPKMSDPKDRKAIFLWVRDLDVTEEQRKLGYLGNFAKISLVKLPNGKWTLSMVRVDIPLRKHPLYVKVERRYPNAGHPVIRAADRKKPYPSMQAANDALMQMHEEYPEISIPGVNRLKIMIYKKAEKGQSPIQRIELNVVKKDEGVYHIEMKPQDRKYTPAPLVAEETAPVATKAKAKAAPKPKAEKTEPKGYYTEMVSKRRARKKK